MYNVDKKCLKRAYIVSDAGEGLAIEFPILQYNSPLSTV